MNALRLLCHAYQSFNRHCSHATPPPPKSSLLNVKEDVSVFSLLVEVFGLDVGLIIISFFQTEKIRHFRQEIIPWIYPDITPLTGANTLSQTTFDLGKVGLKQRRF